MTSLLMTVSDNDGSGVAAGFLLFLFGFGIVSWIVPGIIASCRKHHNRGAIWAITILLGWTFVGWVIAFVWAFTNSPPNQAITINNSK
jgi:hypothetical protein